VQPGDRVVLKKDPLLYGVMRVGVKTADGRFVAEPCHPNVAVHKRQPEIFFEEELELFTDELVDVHEAAAKLEELDTQRAQDADRETRGDEGRGSE
jgi:hypothetical protein